jgi:hypothetical protein
MAFFAFPNKSFSHSELMGSLEHQFEQNRIQKITLQTLRQITFRSCTAAGSLENSTALPNVSEHLLPLSLPFPWLGFSTNSVECLIVIGSYQLQLVTFFTSCCSCPVGSNFCLMLHSFA